MSEDFIRLPPDGTGKRVRAIRKIVNGVEVYEEVEHCLTGRISEVPPGRRVTRIVVGEDSDGNISEIGYYEGDTLLFKLVFSNAGSVASTWEITREEPG